MAAKKSAKAAPAKKAPVTAARRGLDFPGMPKTGGKLQREYKGKTYVVTVTKDGSRFDGKMWESLTAIARDITGIKMLSGPGFFGLKKAAK
jgi:hypothetical protein